MGVPKPNQKRDFRGILIGDSVFFLQPQSIQAFMCIFCVVMRTAARHKGTAAGFLLPYTSGAGCAVWGVVLCGVLRIGVWIGGGSGKTPGRSPERIGYILHILKTNSANGRVRRLIGRCWRFSVDYVELHQKNENGVYVP